MHIHVLFVRLMVVISIGTICETCSADSTSLDSYDRDIKPLLQKYCGDCHGGGSSDGNVTLDHFQSAEEAAAVPELWWKVLKNLRSGVMPPADSPRLEDSELEQIAHWIKTQAFQIRTDHIDPGSLSVRRLNRSEYGNTVSDLMGIEFDAALLFPPEDSGGGFDNLGDALTFSPMLMEKYLQAARAIVGEAVPTVCKVLPHQTLVGSDFQREDSKTRSSRLDGKKSATVEATASIDEPGDYTVACRFKVDGSFEFDPARYTVLFRIDGQERLSQEFGWGDDQYFTQTYDENWSAGEHAFELSLEPVVAKAASDGDDQGGSREDTSVHFELVSLRIEGPTDTKRLVHPDRYERFFTRDEPPLENAQREAYATEVLRRFTNRAYRGPVDDSTIDRLVKIAQETYRQPEATFEQGIARAMVAVLASPRFLFRLENVVPPEDPDATFGLVDEYSLASRLSYLLWSTMPDDELFRLAEGGMLRAHLAQQIDRMMSDDRSRQFVRNFVGQWLRTRDVTQIVIDPLVVLGYEEEFQSLRENFRSRSRRLREEEMSEDDRQLFARYRELRSIQDRFDSDLRTAIRRETEMCFEHIVSEDRSLLELLDSDYTFLNEKLAEHYDIPGVDGSEMRRVELAKDSVRGGVVTQASMLVITSNPTRTSPVKRGLFILDNLLGTPAPPAPGSVPELEDSASRFGDHEPTLRELLAAHRENALCASCHARMDPLGLALENFNALGMWRDSEHGQAIDPSGSLITGEEFQDVRELKRVLKDQHAADFYRCVTQKMLTYAIGRSLDFRDEETIDRIVQRLESQDGRFSSLLQGVIESAPFQKLRIKAPETVDLSSKITPPSTELAKVTQP